MTARLEALGSEGLLELCELVPPDRPLCQPEQRAGKPQQASA